VAAVAYRRGGAAAGAGIGLLATGCLFYFAAAGRLWNPTLVPSVSLLAAGLLLAALRSKNWRDFLFVGAASWLLGEAHIVGFALVPAALATAIARSDRPTVAALAAVLGGLVPYWLLSPGAAAGNLEVIGATPIVAVFIAAIGAGLVLRTRSLQKLSPTHFLALIAGAFALLAPAAWLIFDELQPRYTGPGVWFALLAGALSISGRWPSGVAAVLAILLIKMTQPTSSHGLTTGDSEVVEELAEYGAYADLLWSLHAATDYRVAVAVGVLEPDANVENSAAGVTALWVNEAPGAEWRWIPAAEGGFAIRAYVPWVLREGYDACRYTGECETYEPTPAANHLRVSWRTGRLNSGESVDGQRFRFPISVPTEQLDQSREIVLIQPSGDLCQLRISEVLGLPYERLDSDAVRIDGIAASGTLEIEASGECEGRFEGVPPTWVEAPELTTQIRTAARSQ
jgi:hypothetical protein